MKRFLFLTLVWPSVFFGADALIISEARQVTDGFVYLRLFVWQNADHGYPAVVRLNRNGQIDRSFARSGILSFENWLGGSKVRVSRIEVDGQGFLFAAGSFVRDGEREIFVSKFEPSGKPASFAHAGSVVISNVLRAENDGIWAMAIGEDGAVALAFELETGLRGRELAVGLLHRFGLPVPEFGDSGLKRIPRSQGLNLETLALKFGEGAIELVAGREREPGQRFTAYRFRLPLTAENDVTSSEVTDLRRNGTYPSIPKGVLSPRAENAPDGKHLYVILTSAFQSGVTIRRYDNDGTVSHSISYRREKALKHFTLYNTQMMPDGTLILVGQRKGSPDLHRLAFNPELELIIDSALPKVLKRDAFSCSKRLLRLFRIER